MKLKQVLFITILSLFTTLVEAQTKQNNSTNSLGIQFSAPIFYPAENYKCAYTDSSNIVLGDYPWSPIGLSFEKQFSNDNIFAIGTWGWHSDLKSTVTISSDTNSNSIIESHVYKSIKTNFSIEYKIKLNTNSSRLYEFVGLGMYPEIGRFVYGENVIPNSFTSYYFFPTSVFYTNLNIALLISIKHKLSERLFFDLSVPTYFASLSYSSTKVDKWIMNSGLQYHSSLKINIFDLSFRPYIGLTISL